MSILIKRSEDLLIQSLKLEKKKKYNVTRKDGYRINITKIRNGASNNDPLSEQQLKLLNELHTNKSYKEIMAIMHISRNKVARNIQKLSNYQWKPSEKHIKKHERKIIKLRKQGYSYVQIRKKLHVTSTLIFLILERHTMQGQYRKNYEESLNTSVVKR